MGQHTNNIHTYEQDTDNIQKQQQKNKQIYRQGTDYMHTTYGRNTDKRPTRYEQNTARIRANSR